ncbi:MAG: GGDEF domain-containing protein [Epsilonproteobacteria bacterium]|nr:MAG: GGDEF domain-containing protein [Campylobacterota bacterium]RLA64893.1 MAG: GGDEF domain-containing protein [Campylobacterota bacterium]
MAKEDSSTHIITDIHKALAAADKEAEMFSAALLVIGGDLNGTLYDLDDNREYNLGRSIDNEISLEFDGISRKHCKVIIQDDNVTLMDAGSKNGTFLNNNKIETKVTLKKGDIIKIGKIAFKFLPKGDTERLTYDKLQKEANIDKWTGAYNKTYFNSALDQEVKKSKISGTPLSLIILDLDFFKRVNDNYGHDAGDYVLKAMSDIIFKSAIRTNDVFARYGGEEFCILLPDTNLKQSFAIADRLRIQIQDFKFIYDGVELPVTASLGVSDYRQGVNSPQDLFKRADKAIYSAKKSGRNKVHYFKPEDAVDAA